MIEGTVTLVETVVHGAVATSWTGTTMTVTDAGQLPHDGGTLTPDDGDTLIRYTSVTDGLTADDPDVVTTTTPTPTDWPGPDIDPEDSGQVWMQLWPETLDVIATVSTPDGDVPAVVPHALRPLLTDGVRDPRTAEMVRVDLSGPTPTVHDVVARRAEIGMNGLSTGVRTAIASASGRATIIHATTRPDGPGTAAGDTWFRHDATGATTGMWSWDGQAWHPMTVDSQIIGNLDAGKITSGSLSGIDIWSPSSEAVPRVHVGASRIEVVRSGDGDAQFVSTVSLGGDDADRMMLSDTSGSALAGFESDGSLLAGDASINGSLTVGGVDITDLIGRLPQGIVARQKLGSSSAFNNITITTSETPLLVLEADLKAGREYRFTFSGMIWSSGSGVQAFYVKMSTGAVSMSSQQVGSKYLPTNGNTSSTWSVILPVQDSDVTAQILLSSRRATSGQTAHINSSDIAPTDIYIEDIGSYGSWGDGSVPTQPGSSTPTPDPVRTYTRTWNAAATRSWRGGSVNNDCLRHGYYRSPGYSVVLWNGDPSTELSSDGVHIKSVELYLRNTHWYYSAGGRARIGHFDATALPSAPQTSGGGVFTTGQWKVGAAMWIPIPSGWWSGIAWGRIRGFTLGEGAGTDRQYYGKFSNALSDCRLRVTYTK